jgi:hypothetical protein
VLLKRGSRRTLLLALMAVFCAQAGLLYVGCKRQNTTPEPTPAEPQGGARTPQPPPPPNSVRDQVQGIVAQKTAQIHTERELDQYLAELEARARSQRRITALDVEPGIALIRGMTGTLGADKSVQKMMHFSDAMNRLATELNGQQPQAP